MRVKEEAHDPRSYDLQRIQADIAKLNDTLKTVKVIRVKYRDKTGGNADG
jgi:hypothetical protein